MSVYNFLVLYKLKLYQKHPCVLWYYVLSTVIVDVYTSIYLILEFI